MLKTIDLWPDDIATKRVRAPIAILREQAALLGQKTRNMVQGDVVHNSRMSNSEYFVYDFYIEAPTLENYGYKLLSVYHHIALYPLEIDVEATIFQEVSSELTVGHGQSGDLVITVDSEEDFVEALRLIFRANKTTRVVTALLSQIDPDWNQLQDSDNEEIPF